MKFLLSASCILFTYLSIAQCNPTKTKMMVIGDSWAFFSWTNNSYNENCNRFGFSDVDCYSTATLSVNGAEASDYFTDPARVQELEDYINSNSDLEYVHFSLGGNDALGTWNKNMTTSEEDALLDTIMIDIKKGIDTVHSFNPGLKVILAGYDYPNFDETVGTMDPLLQPYHPFYDMWAAMGKPNAAEINQILTKATNRFADSAAVWNNVEFRNNLGTMQWYFGQTTALTVPPGGTYQPNTAPVPGGYPDYPSPLDALNVGGNDSFHLNNEGFEQFIKHYFLQYYWMQLRDRHQTINLEDSTKCGYVNSTSADNTFIKTGNENFESHEAILHFNTSHIDDSFTLQKASIFVKRDSLNGSNLMGEDLNVAISSGHFGASDAVETDDYSDMGDESAVCCAFGTMEQNGHWMRIDLPGSFLQYFDSNGTTEFKLSYTLSDSTRYFDFSRNTDHVFLDLKYDQNPFTGNTELTDTQSFLNVYPNPGKNILNLKSSDKIQSLQLFDLNGKQYLNLKKPSNSIDISTIPAGIYILQVDINGNLISKKVIKQ